jgi:DNA gyrase subunit A
VRLIRLDEADKVSGLAKLPEEELSAGEALEPGDGAPDGEPDAAHPPHILDDGVAQAEASDHLDAEDGETEAEGEG